MACHTQCHLIVCTVERLRGHAMPDLFQPCVLSKGDDGLTLPTFYDNVYYPRAMMEIYARHC